MSLIFSHCLKVRNILPQNTQPKHFRVIFSRSSARILRLFSPYFLKKKKDLKIDVENYNSILKLFHCDRRTDISVFLLSELLKFDILWGIFFITHCLLPCLSNYLEQAICHFIVSFQLYNFGDSHGRVSSVSEVKSHCGFQGLQHVCTCVHVRTLCRNGVEGGNIKRAQFLDVSLKITLYTLWKIWKENKMYFHNS